MRQGLQPLPAPARPTIPPVDRHALAALLTSARIERKAGPRRDVLDRIEALGLGALPEVVARVEGERDPERADEWREIASRIASRVRVVRLAHGSAPYPRAVRALAAALQGRRLDPTALADLLARLGGLGEGGPAAFTVDVARADDGTGIVVEFSFAADARRAVRSVQYSASVTAGRRGLCGVSGGGVARIAAEPEHYGDFADALAEAMRAPPDDPVDARYELRFR